ncbi:MAG: hypothetical protein DHS20C16_11180 [Phycisphaerae bacterium]|nr:MAG: hypothetical protein DHS20C16_11180 [Phycisphaerae bacterium]
MTKILAIFVAVASFLAVPAMCMGGMISHACECASEIACLCETDCEHEPDGGHDGGHDGDCRHEGGCADDPCSVRVVLTQRQGDDVVTVSQPIISNMIILTAVSQTSTRLVRAGTHEWAGGITLPLPPSDLPLLI